MPASRNSWRRATGAALRWPTSWACPRSPSPAISTGVYGYPRRAAAEIAIGTLTTTPTDLGEVLVVAFDDATLRTYEDLLTD